MSGVTISPPRDDVEPVKHETVDRIVTGSATVLPFVALGVAVWQSWGSMLSVLDVVLFVVFYVATALGVTVGYHRHLTHRSFKTKRWVRVTLSVCGSGAVEGPVISWVADHRKHHAFSDQEGDPHSPHVGHGGGWRGTLAGLVHAHMGWLFVHDQRGKRSRYAPDLLADPALRFVDRTFLLWVILGFALPFALGFALGGTLAAGLSGLLWGGAVRMAVLHHVTFSINSLCHTFGRRRFATSDESRNLAWLALPSMGEAWHNNHHAFPTSAAHGLRVWEVDPSALLIRALEATGLAWDVQRISRERQEQRYGS
ncbi:acyl-CoA desaturase [Solirubrobacter phytolaccae]|uniref:Acyl-CoA desaturase n=1 Tax=Solirubrobacter phytolaccae TaxID=1404360 RepID=A0A9X3NB74_9ACTN|nr:acyl-CoA desaturase [Solirubrobacter phytolaccae]MDA0182894.1 acyl-CoA desaturase [Solirubrobacter phytolaccae]